MLYTISSTINGVTSFILSGKNRGDPYTLVKESGSLFNIRKGLGKYPCMPLSVPVTQIIDSDTGLFAGSNGSIVISNESSSGWGLSYLDNNRWIYTDNVEEIPNDKTPVQISPLYYCGVNTQIWYVDGNSVKLETVQPPFQSNDPKYQFFISPYSNVVGDYNVLSSSAISTNNIITTANSDINRRTMIFDFSNYPDLTVTSNELCSPTFIQSYKGHIVSPTELYLTENKTNIEIAVESGNIQPNFIVLKSFNKNHAHIVKFNDNYLFISKESGISAKTLEDLNKINATKGYPKMYPLRNAINCPNVCDTCVNNTTSKKIEPYFDSHINRKYK